SPFCLVVVAFRHEKPRNHENRGSQWNVYKKYPPPGKCFDEPTAKHRTEARRNRRKSRPGADRSPSLFFTKVRAYQGETSRHKQSGAHALNPASDYQLHDIRCQAAPSGSEGKNNDPDHKYASSSEPVTKRSANQY